MLRTRWILAAAIAGTLAAQGARAEVATIFATTGNPKIRRGPAEKPAPAGTALDAGDVVVTDADSTAKILMKDRSVMDISASTAFRIENLDDGESADRQATVQTDFGKLRVSVNKKLGKKGKFLMRTPSTVMAVRGTEFVATSLPGGGKETNLSRESVTVLDGKVEVRDRASKDEPVVLERGKRMDIYLEFARQKVWEVVRKAIYGEKEAGAKRRQEVKTLDDAELALLLRQSRIEEQTFRQLTVLDDHGGGEATLRVALEKVPVPELPTPGAGDIRTPAGPPTGYGPDWRR